MIKEGQEITYEEAIKAGWLLEGEGVLNGTKYWRWVTLVSPDGKLMVTFHWSMIEGTVERAE